MGRGAFTVAMGETPISGTRVVIIDGHEVVRAGLESWLTGEFTLVASFTRTCDCLTWLGTGAAVDVVVAEIQHDGHAPDFDRLRALCAAGPKVVVHSVATSHEVILAGLDAGAGCYVAKSDGREHLFNAIRGLCTGDGYTSPRMAAALMRTRVNLSEREKQVLVAWLGTESKDDVGGLLRIAPATVRTHLQRVRAKYAAAGRLASTKSALLARAVEDGLIGLRDLDCNARRPG